MFKRNLTKKITEYLSKFPIVTVTGVRQCGKSTLLREAFPKFTYVSLEDPDIRAFAEEDSRGFLDSYPSPCIIDEAQRVPNLFSYLQTKVDLSGNMGSYILSGSHNFLLMEGISQSLAGRTAVLTLNPLSLKEIKQENLMPDDIYELLFKGFYPAIYSRDISPTEYFPSYVNTYIERDVRQIRNIPNSSSFIRFIKLLGARSGQIINQTELAGACGVSVPTIREWISVLKQSYVIFELPPYYRNFSKRLVKSSKIYFYDTGFLCYTLGIESKEQLMSHDIRGGIFETMVVSEYFKRSYEDAKTPHGYFWRDSNQNEVDLITEKEDSLSVYEIKSSSTMNRNNLKNLTKFAEMADVDLKNISCIYTGDKSVRGSKGNFIRFDEVF